ncbi:uncharacterized protein VP01_13161g1 [Puccinia sorghi]|uniref:Uncharacterized protein n=1 Tax=Puccinia sorghi TaxID=27349 RepID=A0A0L6VNC4_9BASI|nr:uncharacterized protein VP01_13161g1 [Puccinia sorghi]
MIEPPPLLPFFYNHFNNSILSPPPFIFQSLLFKKNIYIQQSYPHAQARNPYKTAGHLKKDKNLVIIKWLNIEQNYNSFFGTGKAPTMKDQFNTYKDKYKKVDTKSISMGFGLTNEDQKAEISTVNEKLESMCHHYHVMKELMGD